jgi:hypothetical protein
MEVRGRKRRARAKKAANMRVEEVGGPKESGRHSGAREDSRADTMSAPDQTSSSARRKRSLRRSKDGKGIELKVRLEVKEPGDLESSPSARWNNSLGAASRAMNATQRTVDSDSGEGDRRR